MKKLLAAGCSFTDEGHSLKEEYYMDYKKWPEYLANLLDYDFINLGESGASNQRIFTNIINYLALCEVDLVCVLWTSFDRFPVYGKNICPVFEAYSYKYLDDKNYVDFCVEALKSDKGITTDQNLMWMYLMQEYCKNNDIPYVFYQGTNSYETWTMKCLYKSNIVDNDGFKDHSYFYKKIVDSKYFNLIDQDFFIDFPFTNLLGGSCFSEKYLQEGSRYRISDTDGHPNDIGHELISEIFYRRIYEKVF